MVKTIPMTKSDYLKYLKKQEVSGKPIVDKIGKLNKFYLPLSEWIYSVYSKDFETKIIGLSGGQGTGKTRHGATASPTTLAGAPRFRHRPV